MNRTIELSIPQAFIDALSEEDISTVDPRVCAAVGFLVMWAVGGPLTKVRVHGDRTGELTANYADDKGERQYVIGAIPRADWTYSFHS